MVTLEGIPSTLLLVKLIAAAPLLPLHLKEPGVVPIRTLLEAQDFINASQFLYGANSDSLLQRGRIMIGLFSLALAIAVLAAAREMFGREAALLALVLLAFEPVLLANGAIITTDAPLACLFFLSVYTFYRYVKRPSLARLALCAVVTGLTLVAKHSGVAVLPILAVLAIVELLTRPSLARPSLGQPRTTADDASISRSVRSRAVVLAAALLVIAISSYLILWAFYGFRYAARPPGLQMVPSLQAYSMALPNSADKALVGFFARHHLLPEAYLYGWVDILIIPITRPPTFVFGKIYGTGQWFFFPAMILIKSTITLLALLALVPFLGLWRRHRRELLFLAIPAAIFLLIAILSGLNLGVRHILPMYPFCIVLAAAAGWELASRSRALAFGLAALVIFAAASSLHAFPDYLAYSNEAFGGPSNTYRVVTDSNADWGQGLKWVKRYLDRDHISDCWIDYYNPFVDPRYYGVGCKPLPSAWVRFGFPQNAPLSSTISGTIILSATEVEGLFWGPGTMNPYQQFRDRRPDAALGNIMLVYHGNFDVPLLSAYSRSAMAATLLQQGKIPAAIEEARAAAQQAPDSADIQAGLARILLITGQRGGTAGVGHRIASRTHDPPGLPGPPDPPALPASAMTERMNASLTPAQIPFVQRITRTE